MNITDSTYVADIVRDVAVRMHNMIGPAHVPNITNRDRAAKEAQHHIVEVFVVELLATWVTKNGPLMNLARIDMESGREVG